MEKKEKQKIQLQKAKTWNLVSLILKAIGLVMVLFQLPGNLNPDKKSFEIAGANGDQLYAQANSLMTKGFVVVSVIVSIAVAVLLFMNHKKLKAGQLASKTPYYLYLIWMFITIIRSFFEVPTMTIPSLPNFSIYMQIGMAIGSLIAALPIIITLVHVFKADIDEEPIAE